MHYHNHSCSCEHQHIKFCMACLKPFCEDCGKEWAEPCTLSHYYPWYGGTYTIPCASTAGVSAGDLTTCADVPVTLTCQHL